MSLLGNLQNLMLRKISLIQLVTMEFLNILFGNYWTKCNQDVLYTSEQIIKKNI